MEKCHKCLAKLDMEDLAEHARWHKSNELVSWWADYTRSIMEANQQLAMRVLGYAWDA